MHTLILASQSPRRQELLARLVREFTVHPAQIDESVHKGELPLQYCQRVTLAKAQKVHAQYPGAYVLAADTPVIVGRRVLQTPVDATDAEGMLRLMSGRRVTIPTAVCLMTPTGTVLQDVAKSWMKFKPLTPREIAWHLADPQNWQGASGAFKIQHSAVESLVVQTHGSMSGIMGLPLYETRKLLLKAGLLA